MKNNPNRKQPASLDEKAVSRQLFVNWLKTGLGVGLLCALAGGALYFAGVQYSFILVILGLFGVVLPVWSWYNSASLVKRLMKCEKPNPKNEDHMRLVRLVDELFPLTGLKKKPEVMVSPIPMPNAFATGRNADNAFIAATEGLFSCGLNDAEIKAVLAHELAHVKSHDVAITSFASVMASLFAILVATGFPRFFAPVFVGKNDDLLDKLSNKVKTNKKGFAAPAVGAAGFFMSLVLFWVISFFAKFITLFVSRARESAADVLAASWTGDPCSLSTGLQKIVDWTERNAMLLRLKMMLDGMGPLLFVHVGERRHSHGHSHGAHSESTLSRWWRNIGANHPPMDSRLAMLDHLAGQTCPLLDDMRAQEEADFEEMIRRKFGQMRQGGRNQELTDGVKPIDQPQTGDAGETSGDKKDETGADGQSDKTDGPSDKTGK